MIKISKWARSFFSENRRPFKIYGSLFIIVLTILAVFVLAAENDPTEFGNSTHTTVWIGGSSGQVNTTGLIKTDDKFIGLTLDTGQGDNELYDMDQDVQTGDDVTYDNVTASTQITVETIKLETDPTNHEISDNATCTIITGDTSTLNIC